MKGAAQETLGQEKCTRQSAQIADRNAKFLLSQSKESQCIARNAIRSIGLNAEDSE